MFRFGIMGAGKISVKFCDAVRRTEGCEVAAVASKSMERAQTFAEKNNIAGAYDDYLRMLEEEKPDGVYIGATTDAHFELTMMCLDHRIPVLCEKAMVRNSYEAKTIVARAARLGVFVMEGMWSRFLPHLKQAKSWIKDGRIGEVTMASMNIGFQADKDYGNRFYNPRLGGGACYDLSVYCYDIMTWLLDKPVRERQVQALFTPDGVDKSEVITLKFDNCLAVLTATFEAQMGRQEQALIYGTKGSIVIPKAHSGNECTLYAEGEEPVLFRDEQTINGFVYEVQEMVDCIRKGALESPVASHAMTLETGLLYDEILALR